MRDIRWRGALTLLALAAALLAGLALPSAHAAQRTVNVATAAQLTQALQNAQPGDLILLADGVYSGRFTLALSGTASAPITVRGTRAAVLDGGGSGYGFYLNGVAYVRLEGFSVTNAQKGVMADRTSNSVIDGLYVHHIGEEGIHLRRFSSDNLIQNSTVVETGLTRPGYGEGIYIGSANSNWPTYTDGLPDACDRNRVIGNTIGPNVRGEAIDIKEGTADGEIRANLFDGTGLSNVNFDDSWIDVKGNRYLIVGNRGSHALLDGFQTHVPLDGYGRDNVFADNIADVGAPGYGFNIQKKDGTPMGNVVCANNQVSAAGAGVANIAVTSACPVDGGPSATPTRTPAPTSGPSATPTRTPTRTPTAAPTSTPGAGAAALKAQYLDAENPPAPGDNQIKAHFNLVNTGSASVALSDVRLRYWFTNDGGPAAVQTCDYAKIGCANVVTGVTALSPARAGADRYLEIGFGGGAGSLGPGAETGKIQIRIHKSDWSSYDETNDYSFDASKLSFADWSRVTVYYKGALVWGAEP